MINDIVQLTRKKPKNQPENLEIDNSLGLIRSRFEERSIVAFSQP